jgi:FixJ family two-component response regulator
MIAEPVVFVVDDDESMRRALERTITSAGWEVQTYASGMTFLATFDPSQAGCVVLDVRMPQMSGLDVQEQLIAQNATLPVIFITAFGEVPVAVQAMKTGAVDFIEKPFSSHQLLTCVARAIASNAEARILQDERSEIDKRLASLTTREREVLDIVAEGATTKEIAMQLGIQPRTVEIHRHHVMQKMQVRSAVELVRLLSIESRKDACLDGPPPRHAACHLARNRHLSIRFPP